MNKPFDHDGPVPILYRCIEIEHLRLLSPNGYAERIMRENFVRIAACIAALLLVTHFSTAETPPTYTTAEASSHIGEIAIVCGKVFDIHHSGPGNSFINLDGAYPNQAFTVFIPGQKTPEAIDIRSFEGKNICVTGRIALHKGKPQIVVNLPTQIEER